MENGLFGMSAEFWAAADAEREEREAAALAAAGEAVDAWIASNYAEALNPFRSADDEAADAAYIARREAELDEAAPFAWYDDARHW